MRHCIEGRMAIPAVDPIRHKIVIVGDVAGPSFAMLTDTTKPTEEEKTALAKWADLYAWCVKQDVPFRSRIPPDASALLEATATGTIALAAALHSEEMTFGQFNKERAERSQRLRVALSQIRQREQGRADAEDQARRNAALQYLLSRQPAAPAYQPIQPYQIPVAPTVTTNCFRFGAQVTCTSR